MKLITRHYYTVLDFTQSNWRRFRATEAGRGTVWLAPRLGRWTWLSLKLAMAFFAAFLIAAYGLMFFMLLVFTGNGKTAMQSFTKIVLVAIGLLTAVLVVKDERIGKAIKAIGK